MTILVDEFRSQQQERPLRSYDAIHLMDWHSENSASLGNSVIAKGWKLWNHPKIQVAPPIDWLHLCSANRSWNYNLHGWRFLAPILASLSHEKNAKFLDYAVSIAVNWAENKFSFEEENSFAWYDMAVGLRAARLGFILDLATRSTEIDDNQISILLECVDSHFDAFDIEEKFVVSSNHGLYFAAGQISLASRFPYLERATEQMRIGKKRFQQTLELQFTEEGVHREHSPMYQGLLHCSLLGMLSSGFVDEKLFPASIDQIEEAFGWFIQPNKRPTMFGDTSSYLMSKENISLFRNNYILSVLGQRRAAKKEFPEARTYPKSGYSFVRTGLDSVEPEKGSYLAQNCAFHSRTHKHADHLSFVWYDRGVEILIDPGSYGYVDPVKSGSKLGEEGFYYGHPDRVYVESTRAHNAISVDRKNHQRKGVKPFGSGLVGSGKEENCYFISSRLIHEGNIEQHRKLYFSPGKWLLVFDRLLEDRNELHVYDQWFQFAPEFELQAQSERCLSLSHPNLRDHLFMQSLSPAIINSPVKGVVEPQRQGWMSKEVGTTIPIWSTSANISQTQNASFATLFYFGKSSILDEETSIVDAENATTVKWRIAGETFCFKISYDEFS